MKTPMQKPASGKSHYTPEFKEEASACWRQGGKSPAKVAAELGIRAPANQQRPGRLGQMQAEIERLRAENAKLFSAGPIST